MVEDLKFLQLTRKNIHLLFETKKKGFVSTREQTVYTPFAFYLNIGILKQFGLMVDTEAKENRKIWKLTEKGEHFIRVVRQLENILDGD